MRSLLVAATLIVDHPGAALPTRLRRPRHTQKARSTMHYPTLEKMLRRFSRQAGELEPEAEVQVALDAVARGLTGAPLILP